MSLTKQQIKYIKKNMLFYHFQINDEKYTAIVAVSRDDKNFYYGISYHFPGETGYIKLGQYMSAKRLYLIARVPQYKDDYVLPKQSYIHAVSKCGVVPACMYDFAYDFDFAKWVLIHGWDLFELDERFVKELEI